MVIFMKRFIALVAIAIGIIWFALVPAAAAENNAAVLVVEMEQNGITEQIKWQCATLTECAERIQTRLESHEYCDPRVKRIYLEKTHIPGM